MMDPIDLERIKAADLAARDMALHVPCPVCASGAGQRCLNTVTAEPGNFTHGGRVTAWERAGKPGGVS